MTKNKLIGSLMLLLTAFIWGAAFIAQSTGMEYVGPFTFNSVRFILGGLVLLPVILIRDSVARRRPGYTKPTKAENIRLIKTGIACGVVLAFAACVQQIGIMHTTVGKAGFITSLYIVIVPIYGLFFRQRPGLPLWGCVAVALAGLYLLTLSGGGGINAGDALALIGAFLFAVQIVIIDRYSGGLDGVKLSAIEFLVAGLVIMQPMFAAETPSLEGLYMARGEILYTGVLSCGVAYTFQILGQQRVETTVASMIMSLECVFATLLGALLLQQYLSTRELIGCALMLAAIMAAQIFTKDKGEENGKAKRKTA